MSTHNRWLDWKIRKGLATRGRTGGALNPKGLVAGILYKLFFRKYAREQTDPKTFKQSVGGSVGPKGSMNGD